MERNGVNRMYLGVLFAILLSFLPAFGQTEEVTPANVFDMSIEQLMNVEIVSSASLTGTTRRLQPSAITTITQEDIEQSGARSLNELLDIYVPNLQWIRNIWEPDNIGLRGIMGDRDDKYLLTVNGKVMNDRTHYGVISERDLVLLRDIHHIDIVRGPGSALYGPGAVSMVINIVTHNAGTFQGTEITTRAGAVEEFESIEIRHGRKFADNDGGIFLYAGIANYVGASKYDAPVQYGFDFPTESFFSNWPAATGAPYLPGDGTAAGDAMTSINMPRDQAAARGLPPLKFYGQIDRGDWTYWGRYTRGGQAFPWEKDSLARIPFGWTDWLRSSVDYEGAWVPTFPDDWNGDWSDPDMTSRILWSPTDWAETYLDQQFYQYQQLTGYAGYNTSLSDKTDFEMAFAYDMFDYNRQIINKISNSYREDEYYGRAVVRHTFNERNKLAVGTEISHHELGMDPHGWPDMGFISDGKLTGNDMFTGNPLPARYGERWSSNLYSIFGEYQWNITDQWTTFVGVRVDDHTYSDKMFSPRASLIYTPTEKDTYKLMWARSVRANFEEEMRRSALNEKGDGAPEKLDSVELRWERVENKNLDLAASLFWHYNLELISFSGTVGSPVPIGTQKNYGFELEAYYHTDKTLVGISHGFTQLYEFELAPGQSTVISPEAYGAGDGSAMWSTNVTKLTARHKLTNQWSADGSLRIYWGFDGIKDFDRYRLSQNPNYPIDSDWERGYRGNYYLNLGLQYQPNELLTFRVDGMNLLGIFNEDFNKRNYGSSGAFRSHAPAVVFSLSYKF
ncbi:MAG: TonB-dependent receptor [Planctomycetaceae bacterium]|nr:TonB-dependent receptor [Planctomycetaceae bacterium]